MDGYSPSHILLIYGHFTGVDPPKCHFWTVEKPVNFAMESFSVDVAWCVVNPWNLLHHEKQRGHSTMHSETEWWTCLGSLGSYCIFFYYLFHGGWRVNYGNNYRNSRSIPWWPWVPGPLLWSSKVLGESSQRILEKLPWDASPTNPQLQRVHQYHLLDGWGW